MSTGRVVTANLPDDLVAKLDHFSARLDRSKSWIIKQALSEWIAEEDRRDQLTWDALKEIDEGRIIRHDEVLANFEESRRQQRNSSDSENEGGAS